MPEELKRWPRSVASVTQQFDSRSALPLYPDFSFIIFAKNQVLVISKNMCVLAAKLKEAKEQQQQQQKAKQGGDGEKQDEDKFVEVVEPFLASSKVGEWH